MSNRQVRDENKMRVVKIAQDLFIDEGVAATSVNRIAKEAGCRFYCSSDAHSVEALDGVPKNLPAVIQALGLTEADAYRI